MNPIDLLNEVPFRCVCKDVAMGSYDNTVEMWRSARPGEEGPRNLTQVDVCLATSIAWLWSNGVDTVASCCGHGQTIPILSNYEFDAVHVDGTWYERQKGVE